MTSGDAAFFEKFLDRLFELQQADGIGDRGAVFSGAFRDLFLREMKFVNKSLKSMGLLDWVQIFALEIFHQRHLQGHFLRHIANHDRHAAEPRPLRRSPAAFARNQIDNGCQPSDDQSG